MKTFKQYLIPSMIATMCISMYAIIDGIFIGTKLGDLGLSAINLAWPITAFIQSIGIAIGLSGGIYLSRLKAIGEDIKISKFKTTIILALIIFGLLLGVVFYLLKEPILVMFQAKDEALNMSIEYISIILYGSIFQTLGCGLIPLLKNEGRVKLAFIASLSSIGVNLLLDYLFIYVFNYGLEGAALASVIAQAISFSIAFLGYYKGIKGILIEKEAIKELMLGSMAPFILNYSYSIIIIITNALCVKYGGEAAVAAYTLLSYVLYLINAASASVADSIQPLFTYNYEIKNYKAVNKYLKQCLLISLITVIIMIVIILLLTNPLIRLYNLSNLAKLYYLDAIVYYSLGFLFISISKVISSYFYSINQKIKANVLTLLEPLILTPVMYIIFSKLQLNGLWISFLIIQVLLATLSILLKHRKES